MKGGLLNWLLTLVDDALDFSLWRGPVGPKACIVRGDGHRPGRAVRRAALGARRRLAHLGQDRGCPISTIPRRGGGRRPVRRAPGRVSTGAGFTHWEAVAGRRDNARTAIHRVRVGLECIRVPVFISLVYI